MFLSKPYKTNLVKFNQPTEAKHYLQFPDPVQAVLVTNILVYFNYNVCITSIHPNPCRSRGTSAATAHKAQGQNQYDPQQLHHKLLSPLHHTTDHTASTYHTPGRLSHTRICDELATQPQVQYRTVPVARAHLKQLIFFL